MSSIERFLVLHSQADGTSVSRPELEALRLQRRKAELDYQLNPPGGGARDSLQLEEQQRESRIRHIEWRLDHAKERAATDFSLAGQRGKAKTDFGHER